jgi:hypothetical protein
MSQYLRFVLERSSVPDPGRVAIRRPEQEWAAIQLLEEFASAFPAAKLELCEEPTATRADLYVLPYLGRFDSRDRSAWPSYRHLQEQDSAWVMLYGVDYRQILILKSTALFRYVVVRSLFESLAEWERIPLALLRRIPGFRRP